MNDSQTFLPRTLPAQVWPQLTEDRQHRAILCLAQLAFHVITANADHSAQEASDECPNTHTQTS
jgi:hypothetical protein